MGVRDNLTLFTLNFTLFQCYTLLMLLLHFSNEDTRDTIGCKMKMCFVEKCRDNSSILFLFINGMLNVRRFQNGTTLLY